MAGYRGDSLVYARDAGGALRHVDEVPNGSACGCVCPACGQPLIARNGGSVRAHHFAHEGGSCDWGAEAAAALVTEGVILESCGIRLPDASYYDEGSGELRRVMPTGPVAVTGLRRLDVPGRNAPCLELDCAAASGGHWKVALAACLTHPISEHQRSWLADAGLLAVAIDMKAAREEAVLDGGRHYDREEAFALMQDPGFIAALLSEPNPGVRWVVNGPLDEAIARQVALSEARERERREKVRREAEARRARFEREAREKAEAARRAAAERERAEAEEAARRAQRLSDAAEAERSACARRGNAGRPLVKKGMKHFASGCPLHGSADTVMQCGAYSYSTARCPHFVRMCRHVLECSLPDEGERG